MKERLVIVGHAAPQPWPIDNSCFLVFRVHPEGTGQGKIPNTATLFGVPT